MKAPYPKVVIVVEGGIVQEVYSTVPMDVIKIDTDVVDTDDEDVYTIPGFNELEKTSGYAQETFGYALVIDTSDEDSLAHVAPDYVEKVHKSLLVQEHKKLRKRKT